MHLNGMQKNDITDYLIPFLKSRQKKTELKKKNPKKAPRFLGEICDMSISAYFVSKVSYLLKIFQIISAFILHTSKLKI